MELPGHRGSWRLTGGRGVRDRQCLSDWRLSGDGDPMTDMAEIRVRRALPQLKLFQQFFGVSMTEDDGFSRQILDALPAAVYTTDAAGQITYFNEAAATLWGCRPELGSSEWCGSW